VRAATSLSEVITAHGGTPSGGSRAYLRKLISRWEIDAAHLEPAGRRFGERQLREAVRASSSVAEVVRRLGISPVGGSQAHIGRRIADLRLDTAHFTGGAGAPRRAPRRNPLVLGSPMDGRVPGERLRRALLRTGVPEVCAECGTAPWWNGGPLRLEVDHINAAHWDNRPENLRLLCPNCHAVTDTYRGRARRRAAAGRET
jgi:hypothetical protein